MLQTHFAVVVCTVVVSLQRCSGAPVQRTTPAPKNEDHKSEPNSLDALRFMQNFGYLPKSSDALAMSFTAESVVAAIRQVQKFGAIPQTGVLDNQTLELMVTPRCGVSDVQRNDKDADGALPLGRGVSGYSNTRRRSKRFVIGSEGWKKRTITYFIANWSPKVGEHEVATEMHKAFQTWAGYSRLNFVRVYGPDADIIVAFGRGHHGDGYAFDGPGNILAHAFYPYEMSALGGDIHFDDDEKWKLKLDGPFDDGVDFLSVAVHELGHSLGLAHSPEPDSVMFPYFKGYNPNPPQLGYDDILAMYKLYISRALIEDVRPPDTPHFIPGKRDEIDADDNEATVEASDEDEWDDSANDVTASPTPTFDGDYDTVEKHRTKFGHVTPRYAPSYGQTDTESIVEQTSPATERSAATTTHQPQPDVCLGSYDSVAVIREELFVFKENMIWRFTERGILNPGYPVPITQMFSHLPKNLTRVDAVYERPTDGNIVIFSGLNFWVTDGNRLLERSPKPLSALGLPSYVTKIDAIMVWGKNQKTYIFSGEEYWRYDEYARQLEPVGYPSVTSVRWRGVPAPLDAAMTYTDGMTYFFKGSQFWRFDNARVITDERYPLPAPQIWLGCPEELEDY